MWRFVLPKQKVLCCCVVALVFGISPDSCSGDTSEPPHKAQKWTVSWNAPFLTGNGYGSEALATIVGLNATLPRDDWAIAINQHGDSVNNEFALSIEPNLIKLLTLASKRQYGLIQGDKLNKGDISSAYESVGFEEAEGLKPERAVVVCHSEPGAWSVPASLYETEPCPPALEDPLNRKWGYVVGRTMFETDRLPDGWVDRLNAVDEVWVPTQHHKRIFEEANVKSVRVVGQGIDSHRWDRDKAKATSWDQIDPDGQCKEDDVRFLSVFKWEKRKGHDILIPAFWEVASAAWADETQRGACLIIVTSLYHTDPDEILSDMERYWLASTGLPRREYEDMVGVILLNGLSEEQLIGLYKSVDAFVLPSRGEGWGRPYMEAMSMGLPVIATNWSGPTAFVTEENGYLLRINGLVDAGLEAFPGHKWADPDKETLKTLLIHVRDNLGEGKQKGDRARQDVLQRWSHEKIAIDVMKELERIARFRTIDIPGSRDNNDFKSEQEREYAKQEIKRLVKEREREEMVQKSPKEGLVQEEGNKNGIRPVGGEGSASQSSSRSHDDEL